MVLATVERLKKKQAPCNLYKSMTENKSFFTRDRVFTMNKRVLADNEDTYYYWLKENDEKVKMNPVHIYFNELNSDEENKYGLDFSLKSEVTNSILFSS